MNVEDITTRDVVTATPHETIRSALRKLEDQDIRHLPVLDDGVLVGMLSDRDVREHRLPLMDAIDDPEHAEAMLSMPVSAVMKGGVLSVDTGDTVAEAIDVMVEFKVGAVPVIERHTEELAGILSYIDILRALRSVA